MHRRLIASRFAFVMLLGSASSIAFGQGGWTAMSLHPSGASWSRINGVSQTQQVGQVSFPVPGGSADRASLWTGTAQSWTSLQPGGTGFGPSVALGAAGGQQVGNVFDGSNGDAELLASVWNSTSGSWQSLHPFPSLPRVSSLTATDGTRQVGWIDDRGGPKASLWAGTAQSWISLHPAGLRTSQALGMAGMQQVGWADGAQLTNRKASLWNGAATTWVNLHPSASPSNFASEARGTSGTHQVGYVTLWNGFNTFTAASLWNGDATSWVNLNPLGANSSEASAIAGGLQVGFSSFGDLTRAGVWSGSAESWLALPLPGGSWDWTRASSVWTDGTWTYVGGSGFNLATGREEAILWTIPAPGTVGIAVAGVLCCLRRRRS